MEMDENEPPKSDKKRKSSLQSNGKTEKVAKKKVEKPPLLDKDIKLKTLAEELDPSWFDKCKVRFYYFFIGL